MPEPKSPLLLSQAFAQVLKEEREALGIRIAEAAARATVTLSDWTDVENGVRPAWINECYEFSKALRLDPKAVLAKVGDQHKQLLKESDPIKWIVLMSLTNLGLLLIVFSQMAVVNHCDDNLRTAFFYPGVWLSGACGFGMFFGFVTLAAHVTTRLWRKLRAR